MSLNIFRQPKGPLDPKVKEVLKQKATESAQVYTQVMQLQTQVDSMMVGIEMAKQAGHAQDATGLEQQSRMLQQRIDAGYHMLNELWKVAEV